MIEAHCVHDDGYEHPAPLDADGMALLDPDCPEPCSPSN